MGRTGPIKYLRDTHVALWIAEASARLSPRVRALAQNHDADAFGLAAISLLEIARKAHDGEIVLTPDPADWLIVATALEHKLTLVTHDQEISRWGGVPVIL